MVCVDVVRLVCIGVVSFSSHVDVVCECPVGSVVTPVFPVPGDDDVPTDVPAEAEEVSVWPDAVVISLLPMIFEVEDPVPLGDVPADGDSCVKPGVVVSCVEVSECPGVDVNWAVSVPDSVVNVNCDVSDEKKLVVSPDETLTDVSVLR